MVIGLEVHVELKTASKIFCACSTEFGQEPNTQVCPVCLGLPGSLPVLNGQVVEYAVTAGLATNCQITSVGKQDRKNYFYPDLPKAYQISQYDQPLCEKGFIEVAGKDGNKKIGITRIHIEEDAGKLVHHPELGTLIDYNRGGVPLIEIVSEPDIRSAQEAKMYLQKLRGILLYTGISDCKMNEGSFRCDVNLSVRKKGESTFGTRTEMKNLNSFNAVTRAIENEFQRQIKLVEAGGSVVQETRRWDQDKNKSFSMRTKEDAHDYRYFPDPDLQPIIIEDDYVKKLQAAMPELPDVKKKRYIESYDLSEYDADQIALDFSIAEFFETAVDCYYQPKLMANLLIAEVIKLVDKEEGLLKISPEAFAQMVELIDSGVINTSIAKKVLDILWEKGGIPLEIVEAYDMKLITDEAMLEPVVKVVIEENPSIIEDYRSGKDKALQSLVGKVMQQTQGKADPVMTLDLIKKIISKK
ncbi:MAG: Asp-tRNA(Asn)/Glu-tRNA(Gln) amidotransferase subunit GatB [Clostridia bacterium]|nr:Asp-tRNA(Asn)/Glu-tRNA(Gln) amidotransferase subunit GatB [Clostridia bacterium]